MGKEWTVFSGDEFSINLQTEMSPVWVRKGSRPRCPTHTHGGKLKVFGALHNKKGKVITLICKKINGSAFIKFLKKLLKYYKKIFLLVDNAIWHKSKVVRAFIRENKGRLKIDFFPPYSPEYNPTEQCWKAVKRDLLTSRLFLSLSGMETQVRDYFDKKRFSRLKIERFLSP